MSLFVRFVAFVSLALALSVSTLFAQDNKWPRTYLKAGEHLKSGQYMVSKNRAFFVILQETGNLAVYKGSSPSDHIAVLWSLNRVGPTGDYFAALQSDGNFVIYKGTGPSDNRGYHWDTHVTSTGGAFFLNMQDDGNIAEYKGDGPNEQGAYIWSIRQSVDRINWLPDGKFILSRSNYGGAILHDPNYRSSTGITIWLQGTIPAEKWVLKDGMIIRAQNSDQCLDIDTKYASDNRRFLKLVNCDKNSAIQKGWKYSASEKKITNSAFPNGCLLATDQFGAGWIHPRMATDGCPRWENIDTWEIKETVR